MNYKYTKKMSDISLGLEKADLVLKNGFILNVFSNEIIKGDIAIEDGIIVGFGEYHGKNEIDVEGKYICPGLIDSHLHLESTLVLPAQLIHSAGLHGTTTFIVDPHEAANVAGKKGIDFILEQTEASQANVFVMMPSCVPSTDFEDNGYTISATDMQEYLGNPRILGLGEVMDCQAVLAAETKMIKKLNLFQDRIIDGHAGYLNDKQTACYSLAGIKTDHECCDFDTALLEMRNGMQILVREGTAAKNLEAIINGIVKNQIPTDKLSFCTDDKHIEEIDNMGHISFNVKKAISLGLNPIEAIKIATINTARCYSLKNIGAIAPGYQADLVILSDLNNFTVEKVFYKGKEIKKDSSIMAKPFDSTLLKTVNIGLISQNSLNMKLKSNETSIINIIGGQILTQRNVEKVKVQGELFVADEVYNKVAVFERHHATGKKGIGIVKGFSIKNGAIASTVCHDSHNLIVIGDNDQDMLLAIQELIACGGGYTIFENGKKFMTLQLEIMGLISTEPHRLINEKLKKMIQKAHQMGVKDDIDPFITLSFLALPVIPEVRITARGVFDVLKGQFLVD